MPTSGSITSFNKTHATLEWTALGTAVTTEYRITYNSSFWNERKEFSVADGSNRLNVNGLKPGTIYTFQVSTVSVEGVSPPYIVNHVTDWDRSNITLSMLCSSSLKLHCDHENIHVEVYQKLWEHFDRVLNGVSWTLKREKK
ncbi:hypothetical protein CRUP_036116 [Coryphaenoides rupestris]|nr:hypothetical protein CRUP_036116 [Coryphaenoides rupestris]